MRTRHRWMQCSVLAALHLGTLAAAAQEAPSIELAIEMRDLAQVPSLVMRDTKVEVERTFLTAGVRIVWIDAAASPHHRPLKLHDRWRSSVTRQRAADGGDRGSCVAVGRLGTGVLPPRGGGRRRADGLDQRRPRACHLARARTPFAAAE